MTGAAKTSQQLPTRRTSGPLSVNSVIWPLPRLDVILTTMYPTQKKQEEQEKEVASGLAMKLEDGGRRGSAEETLMRSAATILGDPADTVDVGLVLLYPAAVHNCLFSPFQNIIQRKPLEFITIIRLLLE